MNLNKHVEYTNLKSPSKKELKEFVETANKNKYYGVCLDRSCLGIAKKYAGEDLKIITVGGFPPMRMFHHFKESKHIKRMPIYLGLYTSKEVDSIKRVIDEGIADEIDLVFPIYWYTKGSFMKIHKLFKGLKDRYKKPMKVIVELGTVFKNYIALYEIIAILKDSNIDFFKTNTGLLSQDFNTLAQSIQQTQQIMKENDLILPIKASGGIRTEQQSKLLIDLGVKRIGTSSKLNFNVTQGKASNEQRN